MAPIERVNALLARGRGLTSADVAEIEFQITQMGAEESRTSEPWIWEAVALIVDDPLYGGDAKVPGA